MSSVLTEGTDDKGALDSTDASPLSATSRSSLSPSEDETRSPQLDGDAEGSSVERKLVTWGGIEEEGATLKEGGTAEEAEPTQALPLASPLQAFVNTLVGNILEGLRSFDGSVTWLKRSSAATAAQLDAIKTVKPPVGVEEFSVAWLGVASAVLRDLIRESVDEVTIQVASQIPSTETDEEEGQQGVRATPREVAVTFMSGLQSIVVEVMNDCGCHSSSAGSRPYSRYSLRSFTFAKEVSELSSRLMSDRLTRGAHLPEALRSKYADGAAAIDNKTDYSDILGLIADAWICSFFPTYQQLSRNPVETVPFLWMEEEDTSRLNIDLFFYYFYFACEQRSLMRNAEGFPRGVAVPTAWLEQLLGWTAKAKQQRSLSPPGALPPFPRPIDTFDLMSVSPHDPRRHWLSLGTEHYQVIPESLFDSLSRFFGAGPKYTMYGSFPLREQCLAAWRALPIKIEVTFDWISVNKSDGVPDDFTVSVYVEEALLHSEMREVCHLAWGLAMEEKETMSEEASAVWFAAINSSDSVRICCKGLFLLSVGKAALPIAADGDGMDVTVQEVLQQLRHHLEEHMPQSLDDFQEQTESDIFLSLGVTLHNVNGDARDREITGTMEVAAHNSGVCGLTNVGNTCYMNSALQCLSNLSAFRTQLLTLPISHFTQATITPAFIRLLSNMWCGQHSFAETRELKDQIGMRVKRFAGYQQQDASEFIEVLLDHMGEEINLVSARCYRQREDNDATIPTQQLSSIFWDNFLENNRTFLSPLFFHQSKTVFTCLTCGASSVVFDNNVVLPVSIKEPPQKRTYNVEVLIELYRSACTAGEDVSLNAASSSRAVADESCTFVQATLRVQAFVGPDNMVRSQDVEEGLAQALLGIASDSKEVYNFFFSKYGDMDGLGGDDEEKPMEWWEEKREVIKSSLRVDARVMEVPEHGRVFAWARLSLAPTQEGTADVSSPEQSTVAPLRVWYFLKNVNDPAPNTFTTNPVWMDEIVATSATPADGAAAVSDAAPLSRQIIKRSKEIVTAMLRLPEEDRIDSESAYVAADALTGGGGYFNSVASPKENGPRKGDEGEGAGATQKLATSSPTEMKVKVMRRVSRVTPLESVTTLMNTSGDDWLNLSEQQDDAEVEESEEPDTMSATAAPAAKRAKCSTTTVVIFIQFDATAYDVKPVKVVESLCVRAYTSFQGDTKCTLHDCLNYSMEPDVLRGDDAWFCSQCKEFRETRVQRTLYRLPPCLIVSFKRFKMHTYSADKKDTTVQFPTDLDFEQYLDPEAVALQEEGTQYKLRGVVYHSGSLSFGHYTATAYNDSVKKWVYYNDTRATLDSADEPAPNGAYILCYERVVQSKEDA